MRLGFDAWGLSGDLYYTGMGQYAARLLRQLPVVAPHVDVVAYAAPGEERPAWLPDPITWRPVGVRLPVKLTAMGSRLVALPARLRRDRLDVFHAPAVHMRPFFPPVPRTPCPLVVTLHDLIPMTYYDLATLPLRQRLFYRWNLARASRADIVVTVSEWSRSEILRELRIDGARLRVIHNGADFGPNQDRTPLDRRALPDGYILYAGGYEPRKNLRGALAAYAQLASDASTPPLVAVVDGGSGHAAAVLREFADSGMGDRVHFVHGLSDAELRSVYTHARVLLFPSLAEGFGFPPLQAAACGIPVVASDLAVLREILGEHALFVDPADPRSIAAGVRAVLVDRDVAARLREGGRSRATVFNERAMARRHVDLYSALVGGPPVSGLDGELTETPDESLARR